MSGVLLCNRGGGGKRVIFTNCKEVVTEKMDKQTRIDSYVELINQVKASVPAELVGVVVEQLSKDRRSDEIRTERAARNGNGKKAGLIGSSGGEDTPASAKQLGFLRKLGADAPSGLTVAQASQMIDEAKAAAAAV